MYEVEQLSRETIYKRVDSDYYKLKPTKYRWLSELLWRALHRIGSLERNQVTVKTHRYTHENKKAVTDRLEIALLELEERCARGNENTSDYAIIMGNVLYNDLAHADQHRYVQRLLLDFRYADGMGRHVFKGLNVHVIPSMSGFALVPRVVVEKRAN